MLRYSCLTLMIAVTGCAATRLSPEAARIEVLTEKPAATCKALGEAIGSQGNFFTGDYTSNANLLLGARNDLRNKALDMGGNYVWLQETTRDTTRMSAGTTNVTVMGIVYRC